MRRLLRAAVYLYPAWWRRRYAREFEALLDDMDAGWRELFNVVKGALAMRVTSLGAIPVVCALAGALVGGVMAVRTPERFASTALIRVNAPDGAFAEELRGSLDEALAASDGSRESASVAMIRGRSPHTAVKLTYVDGDPARALRVTRSLTAAMTTGSARWAGSTEIIAGPQLPTSPIRPPYETTITWGGGIGLLAGALLLLVQRSRRSSPTLDPP